MRNSGPVEVRTVNLQAQTSWSSTSPRSSPKFAERFDTLVPAFGGREDYRILVTSGALVAASVVIGQRIASGVIVLLGTEIDLNWPDEDRG